jgi:hypothetical protein
MFNATTIRVTLAALIAITFSAPQDLVAQGPIPTVEQELTSRNAVLANAEQLVSWDKITITAADPAAEALIEWAVSRFDEVGLELPNVAITVHASQDGCDGAAGMFRPGAHPRIDLCVLEDPTSMPARLITLHELAHAWAETTLTDDEKQAFLDLRGLDHWIDRDTPRHEWGAEHIAEVVSWGLMDQKVRIIRIYDAKPEQLTEAFEFMVGTEPLCPTA